MVVELPIKEGIGIRCSVCKKRLATKLCDFPIGRDRYIGHPPRYLMEQAKRSDVAWKQIEMSRTVTCDKTLCAECAISMGGGIDLCPGHIKEMQKRRLGK